MATVIKLKITVAELDNVLTLFDRIKVYRSDNGVSGTYIEITDVDTRIRIVQGTSIYLFDDSTGSIDSWYKTSYFNSATSNESGLSDPRQGEDFLLNSLIMSVDDLKSVYLFGVDLTDDQGNPYPEIIFEWSIKYAIDWLEKELDIHILPTQLDQRYDYFRADYQDYAFFQLRDYPVISVEKVSIEYPNGDNILDLPTNWISVRKDTGQLRLVPSTGQFSSFLINGQGGLLPLMYIHRDYVPDLFRIQYTAGFEDGKVPMVLRELIGKKASFGPFNIAGDLVVGAGIASSSISIDGLSQSLGSTSSATNAGYGARLVQYSKEIKEQLATLRQYYKNIRMQII